VWTLPTAPLSGRGGPSGLSAAVILMTVNYVSRPGTMGLEKSAEQDATKSAHKDAEQLLAIAA
jgi:hypothetical protein